MDTYIQNKGMTKTFIHNNGHNQTSKIGWEADYDGNVANVDLYVNNNNKKGQMHFELNNDDLEQLLSIPSVNQPLHNRLTSDFKKKKSPLFIIVEEPGSKINIVEPLTSGEEQLLLPLALEKKNKRKTIRNRSHKSSSSRRSRTRKSRRHHKHSSSSRRRVI